MSEHTADYDACPKCWGDGYIDHDRGRETCACAAVLVTSVNDEEMLAMPARVDGTPGWMSVESDPPRRFWGALYVSSTRPIPPTRGQA